MYYLFFSDNVKKLGGEYFHGWGCGGGISCWAQFSFPFEMVTLIKDMF